jgi:hypothetical protein
MKLTLLIDRLSQSIFYQSYINYYMISPPSFEILNINSSKEIHSPTATTMSTSTNHLDDFTLF